MSPCVDPLTRQNIRTSGIEGKVIVDLAIMGTATSGNNRRVHCLRRQKKELSCDNHWNRNDRYA